MDFSFSVWPLECNVSVAAENCPLKISLLHGRDVHLMGPNCPIHSLNVNKEQADEYLLNISSII
jgi:hypothetical protein